MHPIKLLDATSMSTNDEGGSHVEPAYAAVDSRADWWTKTVPKQGTVKAAICPDCGRIVLFGVPSLDVQ